MEKKNLNGYTGSAVNAGTVCAQLCRLAYSSVCNTVILPLQDVLELDKHARMNTPAGKGPNWAWRLDKTLIDAPVEQKLLEWCTVFSRRRDADTSFITTSRDS